jgi:hypothetical protein
MLIPKHHWPGARPRRTGLIVLLALLSAGPSRVGAQALQSFEELPLRVNLDDRLRIEDSSGARTSGRLSRLTRDELAIQTDAGEQRFTSDTVHSVAIRGHSLRKGALLGTGVVAVLGALATCSHEEGEICIIVGALRAAPIGAGVGLAMAALTSRMNAPILTGAVGAGLGLPVGALIRRTTMVYPQPDNRAVLAPMMSRRAFGVRVSRRW